MLVRLSTCVTTDSILILISCADDRGRLAPRVPGRLQARSGRKTSSRLSDPTTRARRKQCRLVSLVILRLVLLFRWLKEQMSIVRAFARFLPAHARLAH